MIISPFFRFFDIFIFHFHCIVLYFIGKPVCIYMQFSFSFPRFSCTDSFCSIQNNNNGKFQLFFFCVVFEVDKEKFFLSRFFHFISIPNLTTFSTNKVESSFSSIVCVCLPFVCVATRINFVYELQAHKLLFRIK
jgi:hypothetical protein